VLASAACLLLVLTFAGTAAARTLPRGLAIPDPGYSDPAAVAATIADVKTYLRSTWVRFDVFWKLGQPSAPTAADEGYDEAYLANVASACAAAKAAGLKVMLTVYRTPRWASQADLWNSPPPGFAKGVYQDFYPPRTGALDELQAFMTHVVQLCGSNVAAYECWNEPNLWMFLAPQKTASDSRFAARRYRDMLKHFKAGVRAGDPGATVVGGAFGPYGPNDKWRTAPQRFASQLKALGGASYMDALSHHPYQAGTSSRFAPDRMPRWPDRAVSLRNLNTILKLYPGKPVYLTEYGYNTKDCPGIGLGVGATRQADYLRKAYAYAAKNSRVKAMFWYLLRDEARSGGWSTGLQTAGGTKKPAWYAFSRQARLSLKASRSKAPRGARVKLSGMLTWAPLGGPTETVARKTLVLESKVGSAGWKRVRTVRSGSNGAFSTYVRPKQTTRYRVRWAGVTGSTTRRVLVR